MIKWLKISSGEYKSEDERFYILKTYDVLHGNHWCLQDNNKDYYNGRYYEYSLKNCKAIAETICKNNKKG